MRSGYVKDADGAGAGRGSRRLFSCEDAIDAEAAALADLGMTHGSCAELREAEVRPRRCQAEVRRLVRRVRHGRSPHERFGCEDAPDELVRRSPRRCSGGRLPCADLKDIVGACEHEQVQMHCRSRVGNASNSTRKTAWR